MFFFKRNFVDLKEIIRQNYRYGCPEIYYSYIIKAKAASSQSFGHCDRITSQNRNLIQFFFSLWRKLVFSHQISTIFASMCSILRFVNNNYKFFQQLFSLLVFWSQISCMGQASIIPVYNETLKVWKVSRADQYEKLYRLLVGLYLLCWVQFVPSMQARSLNHCPQ